MVAPEQKDGQKTLESGVGKRVAYDGVFLALSMILGYLESLLPLDFAVPGIKIGLANLVILIMLYTSKSGDAFLIDIARVILNGMIFGNMSMMMYSLSGAILSFVCMLAVYRTGRFGPAGVSITGGVMHNIGQLLIALIVLKTGTMAVYLPVLILAGALSGAFLGLIAHVMIPHVRKIICTHT